MGSCHYGRSYLGRSDGQKNHISTSKLINVIPIDSINSSNNNINSSNSNSNIISNEKKSEDITMKIDNNNNKNNRNNKNNTNNSNNKNNNTTDTMRLMTLGSKNAVVPEVNKDINEINHNVIVGHVLDKTGLQFKEASHDANNFMLAIKRGDVTTVRRLITEGYDISTIGMFGATPLLTSCQYGYRDITELILNHQNINSTIVNHCNEKKVSALLYACMNGDMAIVEKLLILGAKPFPDPSLPIHNPITDSTIALTPLSIAIINGHLPIVKFLLDIRNDVNQVFDYPIGKCISSSKKKESGPSCVTPLLLASFYGHVDVVNELLRRKADWTLKDDENSSVLHHCCRLSGSVGMSILDVFKINGCDVKDLIRLQAFQNYYAFATQ
jgi:ankyrin repeat protein